MTKTTSTPSHGATPPAHVVDKFSALRPVLYGAQQQRQRMLQDPHKSAAMSKLAEGQAPDYMVISCSDSRYAPTDVFNMEPGHIFELQHVGAIVGRHDAPPFVRDRALLATVTYAVAVLKVKHVIILTHTACGAVKHILKGAEHAALCTRAGGRLLQTVQAYGSDNAQFDPTSPLQQAIRATVDKLVSPAVQAGDQALRMACNAAQGKQTPLDDFTLLAGPVAERVDAHYGNVAGAQRENAASAETALIQREHLLRYPVVQQALKDGTLEDVHAMVVELDSRVVNVFDEAEGQFVPLNGPTSAIPKRH